MKLTEVSITYGGKLNLGDYNSAHIEITVSALAEDGEQLDEIAAQLFQQAKAEVRAQSAELFRRRGTRVDQIFAGLPVDVQQSIQE